MRLPLIYRFIPLILFSVVSNIPTHAANIPAQISRTGQTTCYKAEGTSVINCAATGQDGDTLTGVVWPIPRFSDNGDQTKTDKLTGLVWSRNANQAVGYKTWQQALDYIEVLNRRNYLGYNDWRLPNINELESLTNKGHNLVDWLKSEGFSDVTADYYWSSTTYASYTNNAWSVNIYGGIVASRSKTEGSYVWPVRKGKSGVVAVPATGQTACYDSFNMTISCAGSGQDGELQAGAVWPNPRFTDNADQAMTDRLTGLVWSINSKSPGPAVCRPGTNKTWQEALDYVKCLNINNYLDKKDWRLPNRNELASLVNHGQANNANWLNTIGFYNVQADSYWTSTTYSYNTWNAWRVGMHDGAVTTQAHKRSINVWPVRN